MFFQCNKAVVETWRCFAQRQTELLLWIFVQQIAKCPVPSHCLRRNSVFPRLFIALPYATRGRPLFRAGSCPALGQCQKELRWRINGDHAKAVIIWTYILSGIDEHSFSMNSLQGGCKAKVEMDGRIKGAITRSTEEWP